MFYDNLTSLCFSGLMGSLLEFNLGDLRLFPERAGNKFAFQL